MTSRAHPIAVRIRRSAMAAFLAVVTPVALSATLAGPVSADSGAPVAPTAVDDAYTTSGGGTLTVDAPGLLANDQNVPTPPLQIRLSGHPFGTVVPGTDGGFSFTPHAGFTGTSEFLYCIGDGAGQCASNLALVTITVWEATAVDDAYTATAGTTLTVDAPGVRANDENVPDVAEVRRTSEPVGTVDMATTSSPGPNDGSFTYTPAAGFSGTDNFTYCLEERHVGCLSNTATVTIEVVVPVAVDDHYATPAGQSLTVSDGSLVANDENVNRLTQHIQDSPSHGVLDITNVGRNFTYTPAPGFVGTDSFHYCLGVFLQTGCVSNLATVTIEVEGTPPGPPEIVPGSVTVTEGNTGATIAQVPVSLSAPSSQTVTAKWATANYKATAPDDFAAASGTVSFAAGQTRMTVAITIKGDSLDEHQETLLVQFSNPTHATIGGFYGLGAVIITDDDPLPQIVPRGAAITEGNSGTKALLVPVTLSAPSGRTVRASWTTLNDRASAPSDFVAASGTVSFAAGQTQKTVAVTVKGDTLTEPDERFFVSFSNPTNAVIGGIYGLGFATIRNND